MDAPNTRRIVLLGKTGAGKSSLANTIFGEELFTAGHTANSETNICQAKTGSVNGKDITIIDTPGFFDTDRPEEQMKSEIVRCITECAAGFHALLIVFKVERFTEHEKAVIDKIHEYFSEEVLRYATVVFTHGEQLKGQTINDFVSQNKNLSDLVKKCGDRCHVFDNTNWKQNPEDPYRSNQFQVEELLKTMEMTVLANKEGCYTNEMLQAVKKDIQQEKESIRQSSKNMSEEEITQQAKDRFFKKILIKVAGITTGALLGALFGVAVGVTVVVKSIAVAAAAGLATGATAAGTATATGATAAGTATATGATAAGTAGKALFIGATAAIGAVYGGMAGYDEAEKAETPWEASKKAAADVNNKAMDIIIKGKDYYDIFLKKQSKQSQ